MSSNITEIGYPVKSLKNSTNPTIDLSFVTRTGPYITCKINTAKTAWWTNLVLMIGKQHAWR
ncbi:hypothetical protein [Paenibacillus sp. Soil750]|uniref:hypothetical protein n=1 Tax=Paenibacillus sp. Soil750 TaxID=1736398 RepID=UPI000AE93323|nr:hypothetical protein [Paenibacillus sp. Soil750]